MSGEALPHSVEAEQSFLGALLIDNGAYPRVEGRVTEGDFFRPDHQLIFTAIRTLAADGKIHEPIPVAEVLRNMGKEEDAGGFKYLLKLAKETATSANIETYADIVVERATARQVIELGGRLIQSGAQREEVPQLLQFMEQQIERLKERCSKNGITRPKLSSIEVHDFLALDIAPRNSILDPIIPEQGLCMIHAPRGLGKTHLSVGIAVAAASGGRFLKWHAPKPQGVLLLDGEMPGKSLQLRVSAAVKMSDREPAQPLYIVTPDLNALSGMPDLSTSAGQRTVDALITPEVKLLIVDNLASLQRTGVENDAESWRPLQTWALRHRAQGRSILFIHHSGKNGNQRGTSHKEDVLDTVIGLRKPSDYNPSQGARFEVHIEKGRGIYGDAANAFEAKLDVDAHHQPVWTTVDLESSMDAKMEDLLSIGMNATDVARELGIHRSTVFRRKARLVNGKANGEPADDPRPGASHA